MNYILIIGTFEAIFLILLLLINLKGYRQVPISKTSHKIVRLQFWESETTKP